MCYLKVVGLMFFELFNAVHVRDQPLMLIFYLLCYAAVLKFFIYYTQYYAHVKELCLKSDCSIRVYSLVPNMMSVLLE